MRATTHTRSELVPISQLPYGGDPYLSAVIGIEPISSESKSSVLTIILYRYVRFAECFFIRPPGKQSYYLLSLLPLSFSVRVFRSCSHHSGATRPLCYGRNRTYIIDHYGHGDLHTFPTRDSSVGHYHYATQQPTSCLSTITGGLAGACCGTRSPSPLYCYGGT